MLSLREELRDVGTSTPSSVTAPPSSRRNLTLACREATAPSLHVSPSALRASHIHLSSHLDRETEALCFSDCQLLTVLFLPEVCPLGQGHRHTLNFVKIPFLFLSFLSQFYHLHCGFCLFAHFVFSSKSLGKCPPGRSCHVTDTWALVLGFRSQRPSLPLCCGSLTDSHCCSGCWLLLPLF